MSTPAEWISEGRRARAQGSLETARTHYSRAAETYRQQNNPLAFAHTIRHIADLFLDERNYAAAQPLYEQALEIYRADLDTKLLDLANTVRPYALLKEAIGEFQVATELWQEARSLYTSLRVHAGTSECEAHLRAIAG